MSKVGLVLVLLSLVCGPARSADISQTAIDHLSQELHDWAAEYAAKSLAASGLAPEDIAYVANRAAIGVATCKVRSLERLGSEVHWTIVQLAEGRALDDIERPEDERGSLDALLECTNTVLVELGLPPTH